MRNTDYFKNKEITIVGLARSGLACANLLYDLGARVSVSDNQDSDSTRQSLAKIKSADIKVELGRHTEGFFRDKDLVVISPGVPPDALPIFWAEKFKVPVISEIELSWILCPATIIAVTGSNGKTTVTTLIGRMLEAQGRKVFVCGNIGTPFAAEVEKMKERDFVSLEVSSFQLERIHKFKPKISLILNLTLNHLDRYKNMHEYVQAKKRIFMNQDKSDYLVLNAEDVALKGLAREANAQVRYFLKTQEINPNQAAVLAVGDILGADKDSALEVFRDFKGIRHRLEYVGELNNIKFINDSKATTVDSAIWALRNIGGPVILIAGGVHKGVDYSLIIEAALRKVKEIILIGKAKGIIKESLGGFFPIEEAATLEEAVKRAFMKAVPGDHVLLSPMCSSFDMFSNYEERGDVFKKSVYDLIKNNS